MNSVLRPRPFAVALVGCLLAAPGCSRAPREPLVTYFSAEQGLSVQHPSSWKGESAEQEGFWYRYFLPPAEGPQQQAPVSVTLLAGAFTGSVDEYAATYLAGNTLASSREEARGTVRGRAYLFSSPDRAKRYSLLLLQEEQRVFGLYAQGAAPAFERHQPLVEAMARSLRLERPANWPERRNDRFGYALRIPDSWPETRSFSGGGTYLQQFRSPALGADRDREPVHAALTVTVEALAKGDDLESYYEDTLRKLGDAFQIVGHVRWRGGYADVMRTETTISASRTKRFYRIAGGRAYSLSFEARDDVFPRVSRWCDQIAGTLRIGQELSGP